jgi:hypothetical protein
MARTLTEVKADLEAAFVEIDALGNEPTREEVTRGVYSFRRMADLLEEALSLCPDDEAVKAFMNQRSS